jgi:uncharacterized protein (TIGR02145 family)
MKTKMFALVLFAFIGLSNLQAQVGIGTTTPDASSILDVESTTQGFLPPRLSKSEKIALSNPAEGLVIYNIDLKCLEVRGDNIWISLCDGSPQPGPLSDCSTTGFIAPFLSADETTVVGITNPLTGYTWMDRNLGAMRSALASDDCYAYGNLYQWGRPDDGHEFRSSDLHDGQLAANRPNNITDQGAWNGKFITVPNTSPFDWVTTQTDDAWNIGTETVPVKAGTDPCPDNYRMPTLAELEAELNTWDDGVPNNVYTASGRDPIADALNSPLQMPAAGYRDYNSGSLADLGTLGTYWSSSIATIRAYFLNFESSNAFMNPDPRAFGFSVRCIKM